MNKVDFLDQASAMALERCADAHPVVRAAAEAVRRTLREVVPDVPSQDLGAVLIAFASAAANTLPERDGGAGWLPEIPEVTAKAILNLAAIIGSHEFTGRSIT